MSKLIKLLNGNWVDLSRITAIKALERTQCWDNGPTHPARIVVFSGTDSEVVSCDDYAQACQMADELATLANISKEP